MHRFRFGPAGPREPDLTGLLNTNSNRLVENQVTTRAELVQLVREEVQYRLKVRLLP